MINKPSLNALQNKVPNRYMLVSVVSKRARLLMNDPEKLGERKPVSVAVEELYEDKLDIEYPEEFAK
ncbi:MAG TPA: DNA-directed RNA polymerase subunit omega [Clostridia bacterium]|nr:DNA-directed RNA polymerase subunit omega [Clostridia bacterium]